MRIISPLMFFLATTLLSSCVANPSMVTSEKKAIDQMAAPFAQGAITLEVQTDPDLNALHGIANSCTLLVVQTQKISTLNKLLSSPFALKSLFSGAGAQEGILKVDRYPAMPGQRTTLHIDRSENSRYIAIVAGYYPFPQKQHMVLVAVPVASQSRGWWRPEWHAELTSISLKLRLGSNSISHFEGAAPLPLSPGSNISPPVNTAGKGD